MSTQWQLLNNLRRPQARLVYSPNREAYYLHPAAYWVDKPAVTDLLGAHLIEQAGETAGVYRLSRRGETRWLMMPADITVEGQCDGCGRTARLRPVIADDDGRVFHCADCRKEVSHVEQATAATPVL